MTTNSEYKKISEVIQDLMEGKGITVERLSYTTNIPKRFITALKEGNLKALPAKPYVRGYLLKIAAALEVEPDVILEAYQESTEIKTSGEKDRLPVNRFVIHKISKSFLIGLLAILIIIVFLVIRFKDIVGTPSINIALPDNTLVSKEEVLEIRGSINPRDRLTLNQEIVYTDDSGNFKAEVSLSPGLNTLEFDVKRFLGRETKVTKQIFYEIPEDINNNESN